MGHPEWSVCSSREGVWGTHRGTTLGGVWPRAWGPHVCLCSPGTGPPGDEAGTRTSSTPAGPHSTWAADPWEPRRPPSPQHASGTRRDQDPLCRGPRGRTRTLMPPGCAGAGPWPEVLTSREPGCLVGWTVHLPGPGCVWLRNTAPPLLQGALGTTVSSAWWSDRRLPTGDMLLDADTLGPSCPRLDLASSSPQRGHTQSEKKRTVLAPWASSRGAQGQLPQGSDWDAACPRP